MTPEDFVTVRNALVELSAPGEFVTKAHRKRGYISTRLNPDALDRAREALDILNGVCICPSHASNRGECPIHDDKGRVRPEHNTESREP